VATLNQPTGVAVFAGAAAVPERIRVPPTLTVPEKVEFPVKLVVPEIVVGTPMANSEVVRLKMPFVEPPGRR
jgi:hypothetical protein